MFFVVGSCYPPEFQGEDLKIAMDPHDLLFQNRLDITKTHPLEDVSFTVAGCVSDVFWEEPLEFQVVSLL